MCLSFQKNSVGNKMACIYQRAIYGKQGIPNVIPEINTNRNEEINPEQEEPVEIF